MSAMRYFTATPPVFSSSMTDIRLPSPNTPDIWERLSGSREPIAIYGTGNGTDKIIDELDHRRIPVAGVFASDGFVRDREFRGHRVISYAEMCRRFEDFTVLLAFGTSRPDVMENISRISSERTLLCPDVPAFGVVLFDSQYYRDNYDAFTSLYGRLADDESRRVLSLILEYKLTGELDPLYASASVDPSCGILDHEKYEIYVDLGAYTGDTVREAVEKSPRLRRVYAFEPEPHAYRRLTAFADTVTSPHIITYNAAAWSHDTVLDFTVGAGRGSSAAARAHKGARTQNTQALAVDSVFASDNGTPLPGYIKFDVEGAEAEALRGAAGTIRRGRPDLLVSVYHRTEDLIDLTGLVLSLCPEYRLYLRRERGIPAWGINLYAVTGH